MRTIADDILTWSWFSEPHGYNFNGFLISDRTGNLAIDPVEPSEQALNELAQRGVSCLPTVTMYARPTGCERVLGLEPQSIPAMLRTRAARARSLTTSCRLATKSGR